MSIAASWTFCEVPKLPKSLSVTLANHSKHRLSSFVDLLPKVRIRNFSRWFQMVSSRFAMCPFFNPHFYWFSPFLFKVFHVWWSSPPVGALQVVQLASPAQCVHLPFCSGLFGALSEWPSFVNPGARMLIAYRSTESGDIIANSSVGKITG
jgi:hypothetical protein